VLNQIPLLRKSYIDVKRALAIELSDNALITTLEALSHEKKIEGPIRFTRSRKLSTNTEIRLTPQGRDDVKGNKNLPPVSVVHGDQNINYGHAGAIGRQSVGTINYQQQWGAIQNQVDLGTLVEQFDQAIQEKRHSASSSEDYQELGLLAQAKEHAEKRDGSKLLETLTKIGQSVVPVLAKAGAEGLVQWVEHKTGAKLS
jgi:hypothetical protein